MITLYGFGPAYGLSDPSPFVIKVELLLKMAGLDYRMDSTGYRRAPKGKLPYIDDGGTIVADSTLIRCHLERTRGIDFDAGLTPSARGIAWAMEKLLEDNLYWALGDVRWNVKANFERGTRQFFAPIPALLRPLVIWIALRKVNANLKGQGLGRHRRADIEAIAIRGVEAFANFLGDKPYLMGATRCGADATAYGFIAGLLVPIFDSPIRDAADKHPNLAAYVARMRAEFYPGM